MLSIFVGISRTDNYRLFKTQSQFSENYFPQVYRKILVVRFIFHDLPSFFLNRINSWKAIVISHFYVYIFIKQLKNLLKTDVLFW